MTNTNPNFLDMPPTIDMIAVGAFVITPHASDMLPRPIRQITIAVQGTLAYINWAGELQQTADLPPGNYAIQAKAVRVSGTTATGLTGWV